VANRRGGPCSQLVGSIRRRFDGDEMRLGVAMMVLGLPNHTANELDFASCGGAHTRRPVRSPMPGLARWESPTSIHRWREDGVRDNGEGVNETKM
jgi:hypothetical protein